MIRTPGSVRIYCFLCILLFAGCAARPTTPPTRTWEKPRDNHTINGIGLDGIVNFAVVTPGVLWRGAQPETNEVFRKLEQAGVKTIVNLRHDHDDFPLLAGTKLKYLWIPQRAWHPEEQNLVIFLRILDDPKNLPVFVHCAEGRDRTGYNVAAYRIVKENWASDDAIHEMFDFRFNAIWFRNPGFLQKLDAEEMRTRVKVAP